MLRICDLGDPTFNCHLPVTFSPYSHISLRSFKVIHMSVKRHSQEFFLFGCSGQNFVCTKSILCLSDIANVSSRFERLSDHA